jgi:hypothetical protein
MTRTSLPPYEEVSLKQASKKPENLDSGVYRITLPGRSFVTLHAQFPSGSTAAKCLAAKHFPPPPKPIREWLAERRREGHLAHAQTALRVLNASVFNNVALMPSLPHVQNGTITYVFGCARIATLFKLSFG